MPKICRDYPNCSNVKCVFLHPVVVEKNELLQEDVQQEQKIYEKPESIPCWLYRRKNLGVAADTVRGAAFSIVKGLTEPFDSVELCDS
jgi:hypothetical protein